MLITYLGYYGTYNTNGMIPIYCVSGITYGMVELIRRVIPRDIVGGNVQKLRRMDALVHIFYEVAGTGSYYLLCFLLITDLTVLAASFTTALALIPEFGNNYSFIITPILFVTAACVWFFITDLNYDLNKHKLEKQDSNYLKSLGMGAYLFFMSIWTGMKIVFTSRQYVWLLPGYAFALYGHRYLENGIPPQVARRYLGNSAWSQIMVGGSNFGELLGAGFVFLFTNLVQTPIPWLRLDALMLLIVWYLPYWYPARGNVNEAWKVAGTFIPISFGWAAGDVSLAAYIQASLARKESEHADVSALGAVMAFLYSTYIVIYAICSPLLGKYIDGVYNRSGGADDGGTIRPALVNTAGVQFTVLSVVVLASTFVPRGALSINPKMINDLQLDKELERSDLSSEDMEEKRRESIKKDRQESVTRVSADICCAQQTGIRHVIVEVLLILYLANRRSSLVLIYIGKLSLSVQLVPVQLNLSCPCTAETYEPTNSNRNAAYSQQYQRHLPA